MIEKRRVNIYCQFIWLQVTTRSICRDMNPWWRIRLAPQKGNRWFFPLRKREGKEKNKKKEEEEDKEEDEVVDEKEKKPFSLSGKAFRPFILPSI